MSLYPCVPDFNFRLLNGPNFRWSRLRDGVVTMSHALTKQQHLYVKHLLLQSDTDRTGPGVGNGSDNCPSLSGRFGYAVLNIGNGAYRYRPTRLDVENSLLVLRCVL